MNKVLFLSILGLLMIASIAAAQEEIECVEITEPASSTIHTVPNREVDFEATPAVCNDPEYFETGTVLWYSAAATVPRQQGIEVSFMYNEVSEDDTFQVFAYCGENCGDTRTVEVRQPEDYLSSITNSTPGIYDDNNQYFVVGEEIVWDVVYAGLNGSQPSPEDVVFNLTINYEEGNGAVSFLDPYDEEGDEFHHPDYGYWARRYHFYVDQPCKFKPQVVAYCQDTENWPNGLQITVEPSQYFVFQYPGINTIRSESFYLDQGGSLQDPSSFIPALAFTDQEDSWQSIYKYTKPDTVLSPIFPRSECEGYYDNEIYLRMEVIPFVLRDPSNAYRVLLPSVAQISENRFEVFPTLNQESNDEPQLELTTSDYNNFICQSEDPLPDEFLFFTDIDWRYRIQRKNQEGYTDDEGFKFREVDSDLNLRTLSTTNLIHNYCVREPISINPTRISNNKEPIENLDAFVRHISLSLYDQEAQPTDNKHELLSALYPAVQGDWYYPVDKRSQHLSQNDLPDEWISEIIKQPVERLYCTQLARIYIFMSYILYFEDVKHVSPGTTNGNLYLNCVFPVGSQHFNSIFNLNYNQSDPEAKMICNSPGFMDSSLTEHIPVLDADEERTNWGRTAGHTLMVTSDNRYYDATFQYRLPVIEGVDLSQQPSYWLFFQLPHNTVDLSASEYIERSYDNTIAGGDTINITIGGYSTSLCDTRNWILGEH